MLQPLSWKLRQQVVAQVGRRPHVGAHVAAGRRDVVEDQVVAEDRAKWTTRIMMNVVTTSVETVTARRTTRSSGHGRRTHSYGRRTIRIPTRAGSDGAARPGGGLVVAGRRRRRRRRRRARPCGGAAGVVDDRRRRRGAELAVELGGEVVALGSIAPASPSRCRRSLMSADRQSMRSAIVGLGIRQVSSQQASSRPVTLKPMWEAMAMPRRPVTRAQAPHDEPDHEQPGVLDRAEVDRGRTAPTRPARPATWLKRAANDPCSRPR